MLRLLAVLALVCYSRAEITVANRTHCGAGVPVPPNRVDTVARVARLREMMQNRTATGGHVLKAYIITLGDGHGGGGVSTDGRIKYISGFGGSNAWAVVTDQKAALWTDGRYFLQAEQELDCHWLLMRSGIDGYPSSSQWIVDQLNPYDNAGADPKILEISTWQMYENRLIQKNISMVKVDDLIGMIWPEMPPRTNNPIFVHTFEFTGQRWRDKMNRVVTSMEQKSADIFVMTALDDIAWLYNLRGSDRETSPLFYSYGILHKDWVTLYVRSVSRLLNDSSVRTHLNVNADGSCTGDRKLCVEVKEYDIAINDITSYSENSSISRIWITPQSTYVIYDRAGAKRHVENSPIQLMKSMKNDVERRRYRECQVRDSTVVVQFAAFLEKEMNEGREWTEMSAAEEVTRRRRDAQYNHGVSFNTISAVGPNAAVIHYRPSNATNARITKDKVFLLDSGGQYLDGTTDVTRTFHYGQPTDMEKEAYTRVLMGVIDLATTVWPYGLQGSEIDARTRTPIWQNGWNYRHGTGHGIGYFLNVHEGPARINIGSVAAPLEIGMFFSDEPGYYEDGSFGIRLETIVEIVKANTPFNFGGKTYLTFHPATLVPFEPVLIKYELLTMVHRKWLNAYHERCRSEIGEQVKNDPIATAWLQRRTERIPDNPQWTSGTSSTQRTSDTLVMFLSAMMALIVRQS